jgi:hypothetical protein
MDSSGNLVQLDHPTGDWAWWGVSQDVFFPVLGLGWLSSLARQIGTYRHSTRDRKLQLQWLMVGASLAMVGGLFSVIGSDSSSQTLRVAAGIGTACFVGLPVSIGIAILKYRLYDIDRLISRSLSYATVSGLLIGVYFGIVVLSTDVLSFSSPVAVAASTLTAAALFNPVRRAVQRQVDRRFNRTGYDAEATIAEFVARLRESVTIDAVRSDLLDVVGSAVEPANASIWMKPQR